MSKTDRKTRDKQHATRKSALAVVEALSPAELAEVMDEIDERVDIQPKVLKGLAQLQCTIAEAAAACGVTERTLLRRLKIPVYRVAWEAGKLAGRVSLRRRQWDHTALGRHGAVQMAIHLGNQPQWLGQSTKTKHEVGGPGGGPIPVVDISRLKDLDDEQFAALETACEIMGFDLFGGGKRGDDGESDADS